MKKILLGCFVIVALFFLITPTCFSVEGIKANELKGSIEIDPFLVKDLKGVIGIVQIVGVGIAAIACVLMGIRYVMSSVEDKADIKKKLIPYVIGALLFFCATGIIQLISEVAKWFE